MKDWTPEEAGLLDEMKGRCLNKGLYIDKNAEAKFKMLCHLEDYGIYYYELKSRIDKAIEYIKKEIADIEFMKKEYSNYNKIGEVEVELKSIEELNNILNGGDENVR